MSETAAIPAQSPSRGHLLRILGVGFGLAVTIGNTIGAGILGAPGEVAARLPNPYLYLAAWVAAGLYALFCSATVAEVATLVPKSGGQYIFAHYTFGPYAGFLVGWSDWLSTCGSMAAVSILIGQYSGMLIPCLAAHAAAVAVSLVIIFALLQWRGVRWGSAIQNSTAIVKAIGFLAIVMACLLASPAADTQPVTYAPLLGGFGVVAAIVISLQLVIYTYDGWTGVIYFSEEVHNPARDIPRSMLGGVASVILVYLLVNFALLHVLGMARIAGDPLPMGTAAGVLWGARADTVLQIVVIVSLLSAMNAFHLMACRILFAMSRDGLVSRVADRVNEGGTPSIALWLGTLVTVAFVVTGTFEKVTSAMAFFFVFNYVVSLSSVFVLRHREPGRPRPFRAWGYPWISGLVLCGSLAFLGGVIASDPRRSMYSLLVLAASYPLFRILRRRRKPGAE